MLDIGVQEILVIMVLALIVFGPDKLPDLGRRLGRAMREFRRASDEFRSTVEQNLQLNLDHDISSPAPSLPEPAAAPAVAGTGPPDGQVSREYAAGAASGGEHAVSGSAATDDSAIDDMLEPYWTSRGGRLLHRRECAWRARVPVGERVPLKAPSEGWEQGLRPCPVCDPKEEAVTS